MKALRGDLGSFRRALAAAGFAADHGRTMYNDDSKDHSRRRLKLRYADDVFEAPQKHQRKLEKALRGEFGNRILKMYFIKHSIPCSPGATPWKSLCIKLQN